ncbi:gamma-glutamylcyclotransferase family protein [Microvirga sp. TS319]|uniref:gamma-glutamylcyclotransferase family protein n=1 Tax=Microvirga sp. TS319 TaxID=3241165 RepID=UPI00351A5CB1
MYYFGYCTWLDDPELRRFMPQAELVTKGYATNHKLRFHAAADRTDRGWCHLSDTPDAYGNRALGVVFKHDPKHFEEDYDDFERCLLTIYGDDGKMYDCWTYRLITPGIAMRPPNFYWEHIPAGLKQWDFPEEYIQEVLKTYEEAAECPRADRPNPSAIPGKSAASR